MHGENIVYLASYVHDVNTSSKWTVTVHCLNLLWLCASRTTFALRRYTREHSICNKFISLLLIRKLVEVRKKDDFEKNCIHQSYNPILNKINNVYGKLSNLKSDAVDKHSPGKQIRP